MLEATKSSLSPHRNFHSNGPQAKIPSGKRLLKEGPTASLSDSSLTGFSAQVKAFPFMSSCNPKDNSPDFCLQG